MTNHKDTAGVGLIEVLVTLLILSIGLLGMAALQSKALQFNQGSFYRSQIQVLAEDIIDRMRANRNAAAKYEIGFGEARTYDEDCATSSANCDTTELADYDLNTWLDDVASVLPSGQANISSSTGSSPSTKIYIVTIQYDDSRADSSSAFGQNNDAAPKQFSFRTEI